MNSESNYKFKFGSSWLDIWDRPFQKGRVEKAEGGTELVDFLIDTGAATSLIPKNILDNFMRKIKGRPERFQSQHKTYVTTNWYDAGFEFCISIGDLENKRICHRYPGPVLANIDKRHGVIGMDVIRFFNIQGILFNYEKEKNRLWKPHLEEIRFSEYLCEQ